MYSRIIKAFTISVCAIGTVAMASAQQGRNVDRGKYEYDAHCAVCHGPSGAGNGPYSGVLNKTVPSLSTLSKSNGGVFPFARVYEIIDGTQAMLAHGTKEMPVWGPRYKIEAGERPYEDYRADPEVFVRARILALTEYVYRLQAK